MLFDDLRKKKKINISIIKYNDTKSIQESLDNAPVQDNLTEELRQIILLKIKYNDIIDLNKKYTIIMDLLSSFNAIALQAIGNIILIVNSQQNFFDMEQLIRELEEKFHEEIGILYGKIKCFIGNIGSKRTVNYSILNKNLVEYFGTLKDLPYGSKKDIS